MPPRQPHPVRPSAARGTRCLAKVGPRAASATSERGSELGDSCSGTGDARGRSRWRAFSVGERYPATHGFPRWFPMHGGAIFWPAKGVNNSDRLAGTYTEPYTVGPLEGWNSQENQVVTINRKALKIRWGSHPVEVRASLPALGSPRLARTFCIAGASGASPLPRFPASTGPPRPWPPRTIPPRPLHPPGPAPLTERVLCRAVP